MPPSDSYHADLSRISLSAFADSLRSRTLIPSRRALKADLESRFARLKTLDIGSMADLLDALKTKSAIARVASETGLSTDYLTLLRREAKSYLPNPVPLRKFPGIDSAHTETLADRGISNSRHLFRVATLHSEREALAERASIPMKLLDELICLSDLSRLYGVGPVFARLLYDAGFPTVGSLRSCTAEDLVRLYEERTGKPADFGAHEIQVTLELAQALDDVVER